MMYSLREIFTRVAAAGAFSFAVILLFVVLAPLRQAN
jgi:hypothetical protein